MSATAADPRRPRRRWYGSLVARILVGMALGALLGALAYRAGGAAEGPFGRLATSLGGAGALLVNVIKGLAGPLLFFAVIDAFLRTKIEGRAAARMVGMTAVNATLALAIGLSVSNLIRPGRHFGQDAGSTPPAAAGLAAEVPTRKIDFVADLAGFIPTNVLKPFLDNSILSIVLLAVLFGAALRHVKDRQLAEGRHDTAGIERGVATLYAAIEVALSWVILTIPFAVFGVVAKVVATSGFRPFVGLLFYVLAAVLGLAIQVAIVYQGWLLLVARRSLRWFWRGASEAIVYALGSSSSLATLPVTLRCLDRMGVSKSSARLAACVGTNLNNDGILLYEAMAVLFVAQVYGIELTLGQQLLAAGACVVAGVGIAGVPEAGLISLSLVLTTVGLPTEILPLLLTVDWFLSRCRAATNVTSDILVAVLLDGHQAAPASGGGK